MHLKISISTMSFLMFLLIILFSNSVVATEISLDATDINEEGNKEKILIGEIKANYLVELDVLNRNEVCNVTTSLVYSLSSQMDFGYEIIDRTSLKPGENISLVYNNTEYIEIPYLTATFKANFNDSAYVDQQRDVIVEYEYRVYDDRGNIIIDSSVDHVDNDTDDGSSFTPEPHETPNDNICCSNAIILLGVLIISMIILLNYFKKRNKSKE